MDESKKRDNRQWMIWIVCGATGRKVCPLRFKSYVAPIRQKKGLVASALKKANSYVVPELLITPRYDEWLAKGDDVSKWLEERKKIHKEAQAEFNKFNNPEDAIFGIAKELQNGRKYFTLGPNVYGNLFMRYMFVPREHEYARPRYGSNPYVQVVIKYGKYHWYDYIYLSSNGISPAKGIPDNLHRTFVYTEEGYAKMMKIVKSNNLVKYYRMIGLKLSLRKIMQLEYHRVKYGVYFMINRLKSRLNSFKLIPSLKSIRVGGN